MRWWGFRRTTISERDLSHPNGERFHGLSQPIDLESLRNQRLVELRDRVLLKRETRLEFDQLVLGIHC